MDVSVKIRMRAVIALLPPLLCWSGPGAIAAPARNDATPPTVVVASPLTGAVVVGMIAVMAQAFDDSAVAGVQFLLNGVRLGAEDTVPPYAVTWNTETSNDGVHILTALARDTAGRISYSAPVSVTVANLPPGVARIEDTDAATAGGRNSGAGVHDQRPGR
jgi:hypothetical protein